MHKNILGYGFEEYPDEIVILSPHVEEKDIGLLDIIKREDIQVIQDAFSQATGVGAVITDTDGNPLTEPSNFCEFCRLVRGTERGSKDCIEANKRLGDRIKKQIKPIIKECPRSDLANGGAPIIVGGKHVASWLIGQVSVTGVNRKKIEKYAKKIGVDAERLLQAYDERPGMSPEQFKHILNLLWIFARNLSTLGYNNLLLAKDLKERKQMEERLRVAEKLRMDNRALDEANRLKSEFVANMSHDLRSPLNTIMGYSELMQDEVYGKLNEKQKKQLEAIYSSGNSLLEMIDDILDISRIEAGKLEINPERLHLDDLIHEVTTAIMPIVERKRHELDVDVVPGLTAWADCVRVKQCLNNLLSNAVKFTHDGGHIWLKAHKNDGMAEISVKDDGIGIPPGKLQSIFEPFYRVDSDSQTEMGGTGLGLSITRSLAKKMGGEVWAESEEGDGSEFHITLPLKPTG